MLSVILIGYLKSHMSVGTTLCCKYFFPSDHQDANINSDRQLIYMPSPPLTTPQLHKNIR